MGKRKNFLWNTHPEIASILKNKEDGYRYSYGSNKKVDFICPECNQIVFAKNINKTCIRGLSCPHCSDGYSYGEKFMSNLLMQLKVNFIPQKVFNWAKNKRYDFYIPELNVIIETHGRQHKEHGFKIAGAKNLKETIENDRIKRDLALTHKIAEYIEIDCYLSEAKYIIKSILNSRLIVLYSLDLIDWDLITFNSSRSKLVETCKFYNENPQMTQKEMSKTLKISDSTIRDYLLVGSNLGLCEYSPNSSKNKKISVKHMEIEIVQLDLNGILVKEWDSIRSAGRSLGKTSSSSISACCKGKLKSIHGYMWMYKEDYNNLMKNNLKVAVHKDNKVKGIIQLDIDGSFIKEYKSMSDAMRATGADVGNIGKCCKGEYNQTKGFKWMYKVDYEELNRAV